MWRCFDIACYWQILAVKIVKEGRVKTALTSHHRRFWFLGLPSRLKNEPGTGQQAMEILLTKVKWQLALVYLDDIVIFLHSPDAHADHVRQYLTLLHDAGISLNPKKPECFTNFIDYIDPVILSRDFQISTRASDAIRGLEYTIAATELRSCFGLHNVFCRFVTNLILSALRLNKKVCEFQMKTSARLADNEINASVIIRAILFGLPVLDLSWSHCLYTAGNDSCDKLIELFLFGKQPGGTGIPTGYWAFFIKWRTDCIRYEAQKIVWQYSGHCFWSCPFWKDLHSSPGKITTSLSKISTWQTPQEGWQTHNYNY